MTKKKATNTATVTAAPITNEENATVQTTDNQTTDNATTEATEATTEQITPPDAPPVLEATGEQTGKLSGIDADLTTEAQPDPFAEAVTAAIKREIELISTGMDPKEARATCFPNVIAPGMMAGFDISRIGNMYSIAWHEASKGTKGKELAELEAKHAQLKAQLDAVALDIAKIRPSVQQADQEIARIRRSDVNLQGPVSAQPGNVSKRAKSDDGTKGDLNQGQVARFVETAKKLVSMDTFTPQDWVLMSGRPKTTTGRDLMDYKNGDLIESVSTGVYKITPKGHEAITAK